MGWISIDERKPKHGERVLVWNNRYDEAEITSYNEYHKCWDINFDPLLNEACDDGRKAVEYWMPLPEKPGRR